MPASPNLLSETPDPSVSSLLRDVLGVVRLTGALLLRVDFTAPWAYESPPRDSLGPLLARRADRLILFHTIREGRCRLWTSTQREPVDLEAGDVVVLPYGDQHRVSCPNAAPRPIPIGQLLPPQPWHDLPVVCHGGGGERTQFVCGYLQCDDLLFNPFLNALPRAFRVRPPEGPAADWLQATVRYAVEGAAPMGAQRLYESIFVEALRLYVEGASRHDHGWIAGLADPVVARALVLLHAAPADDWTVPALASRVGASRSILDDRFRRLLGRPPMRYLTEWRLQLAAHLLRSTTLPLAEVADRIGYESAAAFNRAFHRHVGRPPARWRAELGSS